LRALTSAMRLGDFSSAAFADSAWAAVAARYILADVRTIALGLRASFQIERHATRAKRRQFTAWVRCSCVSLFMRHIILMPL
jgi:hypothetical protein